MMQLNRFLSLAWLICPFAAAVVMPQLKSQPIVVANVTDPSITRDSCGSVKIGNRALWVCRDSQGYNGSTGIQDGGFVPNSASWTDFDVDGNPLIIHDAPRGAGSDGGNPVLLMYGGSYQPTNSTPFYPVASDECPPAGFCNGKTRYAIWPGEPPMIAQTFGNGTVTAYTWINKHHLNQTTKDPITEDQSTSLYGFQYTPTDDDTLPAPSPTFVAENFWPAQSWGYGSFGTVVNNSYAYLYSQNPQRDQLALARVPVECIEDQSQYTYWVDGAWVSEMPSLTNEGAFINNLSKIKQGTFYYSRAFASYIFIGGGTAPTDPSNATNSHELDFLISTAPSPQGPWIAPYYLFSEPWGNRDALGAYSIQAHTSLVQNPLYNRSIYVTYTQRNTESTYGGSNVHPLIYLEFE